MTNQKHKWRAAPVKGAKRPPSEAGIPIAEKRQDNRPTPEREAMGKFDMKDGTAFDRHYDMIARLRSEGKLTQSQEDAARAFEEVTAAYRAELGVTGYRSCLDASQGGFDGGDGNPAVYKAHDAMRDKVGRIKWAVLSMEVGKATDQNPRDLKVLRVALDCVANIC